MSRSGAVPLGDVLDVVVHWFLATNWKFLICACETKFVELQGSKSNYASVLVLAVVLDLVCCLVTVLLTLVLLQIQRLLSAYVQHLLHIASTAS
jgi:hypothetical protein